MKRLLFSLLITVISLSATTINVPADQATIQSAVDIASNGDTIRVASGTYYENVLVNKQLIFLSEAGSDSTVIDGDGSHGIEILAHNPGSLSGFTFINCDQGLRIAYCDTYYITNCIFTDNNYGLTNTGTTEIIVAYSLFSGNEVGYLESYSGFDCVIVNSTFDNVRDIWFEPSYGSTAKLDISNSIFLGQIDGYATNPVNMYYCDYADGSLGANVNIITGNITNDPLFVDPANNNYSLQPTSPCIDSGDPISLSNDTDGSRNDMGIKGGSGLIVEISELPFGNVLGGSIKEETIGLINFSDNSITISNYSSNDNQFSIGTILPVTINPRQNIDLSFLYEPDITGVSSGTIAFDVIGLIGASAAVFNVSGYGIYYSDGVIDVPGIAPTIQSAVDIASNGDTIRVASGTYYENVLVNKQLIFLSEAGSDSTVIDGDGSHGIEILAHNPGSLSGFTFINCDQGLRIAYCDTYYITNCIFTDNNYGLTNTGTTEIIVAYSLFSGNEVGYLESYSGFDCVIVNSTFDNVRDIWFEPSYGSTAKLDISNSIFLGQIDGYATNPVNMYYCDYADGSLGANVNIITGNITNDPLFVDPANNNYSLQPTSPCIDSGDPISLSNDTDGSRNDMGYTGGNNIIVEKSTINFGFVSDDVTSVATVRLNNYSDETISLSGYSNTDDQFNIYTSFPITLGSGESTEIGFSYTAVSSGLSSDIITVNVSGIQGVSTADFNVSGHAIIYDGGTIAVPGAAPTIQSAIDFASNGDTVLVQPGTYFENINFNGKNIVVGSLYLTTRDTSYISQTIINGGGSSKVVTFASNESRFAHLCGFTVLNGTSEIDYFGGGILIANASPTVSNCIVRDNLISWYGGGICIKDNSSPLLDGLSVNNNVATHHGGGIAVLDGATPTIQNSLLFGNSTGELGGAIYIAWNPTKVMLINCTLTNNSATGHGGVFGGGISISGHGELETTNSIVWGNVPNQIDDEYNADQVVNYACIQNGYTGIGNVTTDPLFVDPINNDYSLQASSPCIDAGDPSSPRDQDGSRADMGAFPSSYGTPLPIIIQVPTDQATIQEAVNLSLSGDTVLVQPGTYVENINFNGKNIVVGSLFLTTQDTSYISHTVIDGDANGTVISIENGETNEAVLIGFTIQNGSGISKAGGVSIISSSPTLCHLRIINNISSGYTGGGISSTEYANPIIEDIEVRNNSGSQGGGIYLLRSNPSIYNARILNNSASWGGGGLFCNNAAPILTNVLIAYNTTTTVRGSGIYCEFESQPLIRRSTMSDNICLNAEGGMLFCANSASPRVENSILWNVGQPEIMFNSDGGANSIDISYSNVRGNQDSIVTNGNGTIIWQIGNISVSPQFVNESISDYNLLASSMSINAGHPDSTDSDGTRADMGAFPYLNYYSGPDWHVTVDGDDIAGTGEESNPFASIQAGINFSADHDSVFVGAGTYIENVDYRGHSVSLKGVEGAENTIVDGNSTGSVFTLTSQEDSTTSIEGFTIQNGSGNFLYINEGNQGTYGGGVYIRNAGLNVKSCIISNNAVTFSGGGIGAYQGQFLSILDCEVLNNTAGQDGGGIVLSSGYSEVDNTIISSNSATNGGGMLVTGTDANLTGLKVYDNTAISQGGGIYGSNYADYFLSNSLIYNNNAQWGGGINNHYHLTPTLTNNTIVNNHASSAGGGVSYSGLIDGPQTVINTIIYYNTSPSGPQFNSDASELVLLNSIVQDWDSTDSNMDLDPRFVSLTENDFHLSGISPALGGGLDTMNVPVFDIAGNPRPNPSGSNPDIGAYESPLAEPIVVVEVQNLHVGGSEEILHLTSHNPQITYSYYNSLEEPLEFHQIQVSSLADFSLIDKWDTYTVINPDTMVTYTGNALVDGETYYLRVKAGSDDIWTDWETLSFRMNSIPQAPDLVSPITNTVIGEDLLFTVENSLDSEEDELLYQFFLFEDVTMSVFVDSSELVVEGVDQTIWLSEAELLDNNQYWWTSRVFDGYEYSSLSAPASFLVNTENAAPETFELLFPTPEIEISSLTPTFSWHSSLDVDPEDIISYSLHLDTPEPGVLIFELGSDTLFFPPEPLVDNTVYHWRVVAKDLLGFETESSGGYRSFIVNVSNDNPSVVDLVTPDSVMVLSLTPEMFWTQATDIDPGDMVTYEMHWWGDGVEYDSVLTDTNAVTIPRELQDNMQYFWEVIAMDQTDGISHSEPAIFWTDLVPEAPESFALLSPENDAAGLPDMPSFQWELAEDPDPLDFATYTFQIASDSSFSDVVFETNTNVEAGLELTESLPTDAEYWWRVLAVDTDSLTTESEIFKFTVGYVSIAEDIALPTEYMLDQNYPNPFNPSTTIRYGLPEDSNVSLVIYDVRGQVVQTLESGHQSAGWYDIVWNGETAEGKTISTGIYFARLVAGEYSQVIKMLYLK